LLIPIHLDACASDDSFIRTTDEASSALSTLISGN